MVFQANIDTNTWLRIHTDTDTGLIGFTNTDTDTCSGKCGPARAEPIFETKEHILFYSRIKQAENTTLPRSSGIYENI